jgi:hypothetical protein
MRRLTLLAVLLATGLLAGCGSSSGGGSSSSGSTTTRSGATAPGGVRPAAARRLERALLRGGPPRPAAASCRPATAAEIRAAPFGRHPGAVFSCLIEVAGRRAAYAVQVLPNGCYVAERFRGGQALYGCGAR